MKNLKLIALLFLFAGVVQAQTSDNPWLISAGLMELAYKATLLGEPMLLQKVITKV